MGDSSVIPEMVSRYLSDIFYLDRNDAKFQDWDAYFSEVWC